MANTTDVRRKQGDTYAIDVTILDGTTAYDLTGTTEVKLGVATSKTLTSGDTPTFVVTGSVVTPASGTVTFPITSTEADIDPGTYYAEIQFIQNGDVVTTDTFVYLVEGQIIF